MATIENGSALAAHGEEVGDSYKTEAVPFVIPKDYQGPAFLIVVDDADGRVQEYPNDNNNTFSTVTGGIQSFSWE